MENQKRILGKWRLVETDTTDHINYDLDDFLDEFRSDGTLLCLQLPHGEPWRSSSLFYVFDGNNLLFEDDTKQVRDPVEVEFPDNDTMIWRFSRYYNVFKRYTGARTAR
jgi:hypothetical protein